MFIIPSLVGAKFSKDASSPFDPDALSFFARVDAATGVSNFLTNTEKSAIDTLVIQMKADLIWTKMKAIYPMVGGGNGTLAQNQAACEQNLVSASFTGAFSSGWTFSSAGIQGNGTSAYMNTNFVASIDVALNSHAYGVYLPNNYNSANVYAELGAFGPGNYGTLMYGNLSGTSYHRINSSQWNGTFQPSNGFYITSRTASNLTRSFLNGVLRAQGTELSSTASPYSYYIGARRNDASAALFSPKLISFVFLSDGLTDNEANYCYAAVQSFQTTLSRQV